MVPRLILRTHYQVEEPAYVEFLVKGCTSPVQSTYAEVVAERLTKEVRKRAHKDFNKAAALYAVDLGDALGVITANNTWTDKGHLVNLLADIGEQNEVLLTPREKLLHFRLFLEADGALLLELAKYFIENRSLVYADALANDLVEQLFSRVYNAYLPLTASTAERMLLREGIQKLRKGYKPKTRHHKLRIHLQTMYRLGLLHRHDNADICYNLTEEDSSKLRVFVREIPTVEVLEKRVSRNEHFAIISRVLEMGDKNPHGISAGLLSSLLAQTYRKIMLPGTPLCPISTLVEAIQAILISEYDTVLSFEGLLGFIRRLQITLPRQFRFHVDRRGRPAFIKISEEWLRENTEARS